jgi:MoxR-like ATPase
MTTKLQAKFQAAAVKMQSALVERNDEVELVLCALLCNEHLNLVGPPGTAKSMLLDMVMGWMKGNKFSILLNKLTKEEEVFGPISIQSLKEGKYQRITAGKLPTASFAFCDEIYKSSSAVLNSLLRILNERQYDNGEGLQSCPLRLCVAASNEWPASDSELGALFDRFLFRKIVAPVSKHGRNRLLSDESFGTVDLGQLTTAELDKAQAEVKAMPIADSTREVLNTILDELLAQGVQPGDRRLRKSILAARAFAWLCGEDEVLPEHLEILRHTLWVDPIEQPTIVATVIGKHANPVAARVAELMLQVTGILNDNTPTNAVPKLKVVMDELKRMDHPKAVKAKDFVESEIKRLFSTIIG